MANTPQAKKRIRRNAKRAEINHSRISRIRTFIKAVESAIEFNEDVQIFALFPHTHLRGKSWEYRLVFPDGRKEVVLSVPKYDFNWQTYYIYTKPLSVPKGARLEATAHYDNSVANPWNPDPKVTVRWGEQTWEEMQYSGITYSVQGERR